MKCNLKEGKLKLRSHNISYCLIELAPVSQKAVNRTISDLSYDHLPTKFATVSQNLSEFVLRFPIYDLWL